MNYNLKKADGYHVVGRKRIVIHCGDSGEIRLLIAPPREVDLQLPAMANPASHPDYSRTPAAHATRCARTVWLRPIRRSRRLTRAEGEEALPDDFPQRPRVRLGVNEFSVRQKWFQQSSGKSHCHCGHHTVSRLSPVTYKLILQHQQPLLQFAIIPILAIFQLIDTFIPAATGRSGRGRLTYPADLTWIPALVHPG